MGIKELSNEKLNEKCTELVKILEEKHLRWAPRAKAVLALSVDVDMVIKKAAVGSREDSRELLEAAVDLINEYLSEDKASLGNSPGYTSQVAQ